MISLVIFSILVPWTLSLASGTPGTPDQHALPLTTTSNDRGSPEIFCNNPLSTIPQEILATIGSFVSMSLADAITYMKSVFSDNDKDVLDFGTHNPLSFHDARLDNQAALTDWLRSPDSDQKIFRLRQLLQNPTVDFDIQRKIKEKLSGDNGWDYFADNSIRLIDPRRISRVDSVLVQVLRLNDLESFWILVGKGLKPDRMCLNQAIDNGDVNLLKALERYEPLTFSFFFSLDNLEMARYQITEKNYQVKDFYLSRIQNLDILKLVLEHGFISLDEMAFRKFVLDSAASKGKLDFLKYALETPGLVAGYSNVIRANTQTLISGCSSGSLDVVRYLVAEKGVPVTLESLEAAANTGNLELYKYLIESSKIAGSQLSSSYDCVKNATASGNLLLVKYTLADGGIIVDKNLLNYGAQMGKLDIVKFFIEECRIIPNQETLDKCVENINPELISYLLQFGFIPSNSLVMEVARKGESDVLKRIVQQFRIIVSKELINKGCQSGNSETVSFLIDESSVESKKHFIQSCLWEAAFKGNIQLVKVLVESYDARPKSSTLTAAYQGCGYKEDRTELLDYLKKIT